MILHGNDLMHVLKHHVYDVTGKGRHYRKLSKLHVAIVRPRSNSYRFWAKLIPY